MTNSLFFFSVKKWSNLACSFNWILKLHLIQLINWKLIRLIPMSASKHSYLNGFKNHSIEIVSEVSQKWKLWLMWNGKRDEKLKRIKKHSSTSHFKKNYWLNKKQDLERTMSELGNPFKKNRSMQFEKKINVKMPQANTKPLAKNGNLIQTKN